MDSPWRVNAGSPDIMHEIRSDAVRHRDGSGYLLSAAACCDASLRSCAAIPQLPLDAFDLISFGVQFRFAVFQLFG